MLLIFILFFYNLPVSAMLGENDWDKNLK